MNPGQLGPEASVLTVVQCPPVNLCCQRYKTELGCATLLSQNIDGRVDLRNVVNIVIVVVAFIAVVVVIANVVVIVVVVVVILEIFK